MGVLVLNGLVGLHRITQLQFFSITGQGIDLDYHDIEWFALEMNRDHSIALRLHPNAAFWTFFFTDYDGYSTSSKGFLPTIVDIMVI